MQAAGDRTFVGRRAELGLLRDALGGRPGAPCVLYVHGPGGIGKSALMRRFADEARAVGRLVVEVDGRTVPDTPEAFEKAAAAAAHAPGALLLIDTFEYCRNLETWLREEFLPALPADVLVAVAGRHAPDPTWAADPVWADLLKVVRLEALSADEAVALLDEQGIEPARQQSLVTFAAGHPLALVLAAHAARGGGAGPETSGQWNPGPEVIGSLLRQVLGDLPSLRHRRALEVSAQAHLTTESLLRAVIGDTAAEVFAWLREQPFMDHCSAGLFPHDVVREALAADLRWRDPDGFDQLFRDLHGHLIDQVGSASADRLLGAVGSLQFLYRGEGHMAQTHGWYSPGLVEDHPYDPSAEAEVLALVDRAEGPESAAIARYWLRSLPHDFRVQRLRGSGATTAVSAWLRMQPFQGRGHDPVADAAWEHVRAHGTAQPGEHIAVSRFNIHPQHYQRPSPVMDLMLWRMLGELLRGTPPAWSFILLRDDGFWNAHMEYCDMAPLSRTVTVGQAAYRLFAHDWRDVPPAAWLAHKQQALLSGSGPDRTTAAAPFTSRTDFATAVRCALRDLRSPQALEVNALRNSRLVTEHGMSLREVLTNAIEALAGERGGDKAFRAAKAAYLTGAPTHEAAAGRLNLPYSTYRRHLATAHARVEDMMWRHEQSGLPLGPP
ncbi:ATP-binding protein [Streptomyces sp. NPDC094143]|uniref:ATP-binding protein n=1 Tax=Streptomyces sp. NPDC094143 TaxID=3155310 RepID=UPI003322AC11